MTAEGIPIRRGGTVQQLAKQWNRYLDLLTAVRVLSRENRELREYVGELEEQLLAARGIKVQQVLKHLKVNGYRVIQ